MHNQPMISNLVIGRIEKYQDAQHIICCFLKLDAIRENSSFSNHEQAQKEDNRENNWPHHDKATILFEPNWSLLTAPISQIYQSTKRRGYWKSSSPLRTLPKKRNANEYCDNHQDHGHHAENCQARKNFILKLINEGHLKEFIAQHQQTTQQQPRSQGQFSFVNNLCRIA